MNGFVEHGPRLYARALFAELQQQQKSLEERLRAASSHDEKSTLLRELDELLADHKTKLAGIDYSLF